MVMEITDMVMEITNMVMEIMDMVMDPAEMVLAMVGYGNLGYGRSLGYNGGYGGVVNFGAPLIGGGIRGYDSRFVNVA
ncbi:hypothetical protein CEXT_799131 [Caerostris extrusa]|uniref:Uncharacterized protein n=1 Tax=Caerostris extrusa TaxID=172846 RepID=A0AAV4W3H3_CAEEX|nr:hypothetical protein CEXT_799131 [Caerostris extrusa]